MGIFTTSSSVFFQNLRWNPSIEVVILGKADLAFASSRPSNCCRAWLAAKTKMKIFSPNKKTWFWMHWGTSSFSHYLQVFLPSRLGRIFSINSMSDQFLFLLLFALKAMKVAKTLPEVRGFWKVTWPLNLDFHLRSYDLQFFFWVTYQATWPRASFAAGNWGPSRIGGRKAGGGAAPSAGHPTPMPPPGIITP